MKSSFHRLASGSLLAGIAISIGATAFTAVGGVAGAVLFTFGLVTVVHFKWPLYTGSAGFVVTGSECGRLPLILLFNAVGCWLTAMAVGYGRPELVEQARALVDARLAHTWWECLVLAVGCGFIMTVAVHFARRGSWLPLLFGVPVFIVCGFLHSIADAFYISLAGDYSADMLCLWIAVIAGNFAGCNLIRIVNLSLVYE